MRRSATAALALTFAMALGGFAGDEPSSEQKPLGHWIEALALPDTAQRLEALQAIGQLGHEAEGIEAAVPALVRTLGDDDPKLRSAAAHALGALGPVAKPAVPSLVATMADRGRHEVVLDGIPSYERVWVVASKALGDVGPAAVPELIGALDDENVQVSVGAAGALFLIGPAAKDAVDPLLGLLARDEELPRRAAIWALMGIGPEAKAAVPELTKALSHEDFHTQYWACRALREIGPEAKTAVPVLVRLLTEGVASVRRNAAQALGGIGPDIGEKALASLTEALSDPLEPVREDAAVALGKLGPFAKSSAPTLKRSLETGPIAARVLAAKAHWLVSGETDFAVDVLIGELDDVLWRDQAVQTLGDIGGPAKKAVPDLVKMLESEELDEDLREVAVQALGKIDPEAAKRVAEESVKEGAT